jgi:hypothetical protein
MRSVDDDQLRETPERAESWIAEAIAVSHETVKKVREQVPDLEISQPEFIRLVAQCSILVMIAGIVAALIAA